MTENGAQLVAESVPKCGSAARNLVPFIFFSVDPDFAKFRKISEVPHWHFTGRPCKLTGQCNGVDGLVCRLGMGKGAGRCPPRC